MQKIKINTAVTRIRTEVAAATTQSTNHYTITARHCAVGEMRYCSFNFDKSVPITVLLCCWIIAGTPDSLSHLPSVTPSQICCIFHFPCVQSLSPHGLPEVIFALSLPPLLHSSLFIFLFWSTVPKPSFWLPWPAERREKGGNARGADGRMKAEQTGRQHRLIGNLFFYYVHLLLRTSYHGILLISLRTVVLKVWSLNHQHLPHLWTCYTCRLNRSYPTPSEPYTLSVGAAISLGQHSRSFWFRLKF